MTSDELIEALESAGEDGAGEARQGEETERYFIFTVGESYFALAPEQIREIVTDLEVFPLPACPPYVAGLVNCHGTPYTVFDLRVLFENERQQASKFLILKVEGDDVALGCTEVIEIAELPRSSVSSFEEKEVEARFCSATITLGERRVPVLAVGLIQRQLERDLA